MNKNFYIIGVSYKKADVITRSKFSIGKTAQEELLTNAKNKGINGIFVLSTCNRIEVSGFAENPFDLIALLCSYSNGSIEEFSKFSYIHKNNEAISHFIRVAAGLDSQILGDYEIINQLKDAFTLAKKNGTTNAFIERLYNTALQASKEIKNKTSLSTGTTSVSYAAVQYIKQLAKDLEKSKILVYGLGNIGAATAKHCVKHLPKASITLINRTNEKSVNLANTLGLPYAEYKDLRHQILESDIIIVATGAGKPILDDSYFKNHKKQLIIDLSLPSNVDKKVNLTPHKTLVNIDFLSKKTQYTIDKRKKQIPIAEDIINKHKNEFLHWLEFRKSAPALKNLKNALENIRSEVITNYTNKNKSLNDKEIDKMTHQIIDKIVSKFAIHLKENGVKIDQSIHFMEDVFL